MRHDKRKWHDAKSRLALSTSTNLLQFLTDATHRIFSYVQPFDHAQQNEIYKKVEDLEQKKVHLLMTNMQIILPIESTLRILATQYLCWYSCYVNKHANNRKEQAYTTGYILKNRNEPIHSCGTHVNMKTILKVTLPMKS